MRLKSAAEIDAIARAGEIVAGVLALVGERAEPGESTEQLDAAAESYIRDHEGAVPAFKGLYGFPATLCTSLNDEVVHGIPSPDRRLEDGDLLGVDVGVVLDEMYADAAVTVPVPPPSSTTGPCWSRGTCAAMCAASAGELGQMAPMALGLARISRPNMTRDKAFLPLFSSSEARVTPSLTGVSSIVQS